MSQLQSFYRRSLSWYERQKRALPKGLHVRGYEYSIQLLAAVTAAARRVHFPARRAGGWWWTWRWRLEFLAGWLEPESVSRCRELIQPGMTVVDIGAHLGYYTRLFSRLVGPSGRVLAFEPHPENFEILAWNMRGASNVELIQACVTDRDGSVPLYVSAGHSNHSLSAAYARTQEKILLPAIALSSALQGRAVEKVHFIKCDAEGAEVNIIAGASGILNGENAPMLLFECNPDALASSGQTPGALVAPLIEAGYRVFRIANGGALERVDAFSEWPETVNILGIPSSPPVSSA